MIVMTRGSQRRNKGADRVWELYNDRPAACTGHTTRLGLWNERDNETDIEEQWHYQTHHPLGGNSSPIIFGRYKIPKHSSRQGRGNKQLKTKSKKEMPESSWNSHINNVPDPGRPR